MTDTGGGGGGGGGGVGSEVSFTWNPKHLEIRTRTVEKTLEPLVMQVSQKQEVIIICQRLLFVNKTNLMIIDDESSLCCDCINYYR